MDIVKYSSTMDVPAIKARLIARKGEWPAIRDKAQVSYSWMSKFANDLIVSPRVQTLQRLEAAMDGEQPQ